MSTSSSKFSGHTLYHFTTCPFCIKVRAFLWRKGLRIASKNIHSDEAIRQELIAGGGKQQVPCLRIEDEAGQVRWMYESSEIIAYFKRRCT